jgi:hypothetical protein
MQTRLGVVGEHLEIRRVGRQRRTDTRTREVGVAADRYRAWPNCWPRRPSKLNRRSPGLVRPGSAGLVVRAAGW